MRTAWFRNFSSGFAFLPVVVLVALVGLMIPTVKYVTDSDVSFDNRGFARIAEKAGFDDQTIEKIKDQVTNSNKGASKEEVEKDFAEVLKERREERRAEEAAGEASNQQLQAVVNRLDPEAQQSIIDELATPTPKPTLVPTPSPDIGDVDNELFGLLDQEAQDSIVKEVEEEKKAAAEAAAVAATNKLNEAGYLLEDDKVQIEDENTDKAAEAEADRWAGYADNQVVGQEAYDKQAEQDQRESERDRMQNYMDRAQTHDGTTDRSEIDEVGRTYSVGTTVDANGQVRTVPVYDPNGTLTYQEALAAIGQVAVSDTYTEGEEVGCATLTGQARNDCFTALKNEAQQEWEEMRNTAIATTVIAGGLYAAPTVIPAVASELTAATSTIWSTASMGSTTGITGGLQTLASIPGAIVNYGSAVMSTALSGFTAAELAALGIAGEVAGIVSTGVAAAQCEQGNDVACGIVLDAAAGYQTYQFNQAAEVASDYIDDVFGFADETSWALGQGNQTILSYMPDNLNPAEQALWMSEEIVEINSSYLESRVRDKWTNVGYQPGAATEVYGENVVITKALANLGDEAEYLAHMDELASQGLSPDELLVEAHDYIEKHGVPIINDIPDGDRYIMEDGSEFFWPSGLRGSEGDFGTYSGPLQAKSISTSGTQYAFPSEWTPEDFVLNRDPKILLNPESIPDSAKELATTTHEFGHYVETELFPERSAMFPNWDPEANKIVGEVEAFGKASTEFISSLYGIKAGQWVAPTSINSSVELIVPQVVLNKWITSGNLSSFGP